MSVTQNPENGKAYALVNHKGGTAADLSGGDNTSIIGYEYHGGENQQWIFEQHDGGWLLRNKSQYDKTLHVAGNHLQAGNGVIAIEHADNPTLWDVEPADDNTVILKVHGHGYVLDLTDHGNSTPGTAIGVYGNWGGENQRWRLTEA